MQMFKEQNGVTSLGGPHCWCGPSTWSLPLHTALVFHSVQHCSSRCHRSQLQCELPPCVSGNWLPCVLPTGLGWWGNEKKRIMFDSFRTFASETLKDKNPPAFVKIVAWIEWGMSPTGLCVWRNGSLDSEPPCVSCVRLCFLTVDAAWPVDHAPSTMPSLPWWTTASNPQPEYTPSPLRNFLPRVTA